MTPHQTRLRVRYAETDQMGVVYYANYLIWMEVARVEFCKSLGFRYRDMEMEDGVLLAVADAHCRYLSPARFDDEVIIETSLRDSNTRLARFGYAMSVENGARRIARGETTHLFLNREMKPVRLPAKYWSQFGIGPGTTAT
ncbi:MAG: acyl-CoA thioesterase [Acidobacteriota bacterium]|nr:acyl-CoA thioesterase [Acidobacteriota bacterium]